MRLTVISRAASIGLCALAAALTAISAEAREDAILAVAYGNGVHAYYAGDYQRSYEELSTAIDGGTQDPRAFYFRGLAAVRLGRLDEADADFALGADAEAAGRGNWAVGRSLERIQGEPRLQLEKHRVRARMAALQKRRESIVRHYTRLEEASPDVERSLRPETLPGVPTPVNEPAEEPAAETVKTPAAPMAEDDDEPAEKPAASAPKPEPKPAKADDPFGDDPF
jgi:hypothetical protein